MQWYLIHQSEWMRERLREAERERLAAAVRRASRARRSAIGERRSSGSLGVSATILWGLVSRLAGR